MSDEVWALGLEVYSLPEEESAIPQVGWTRAAHEKFLAWRAAIIQAYCEGREALQVANGEAPKPAGICQEPSRP